MIGQACDVGTCLLESHALEAGVGSSEPGQSPSVEITIS
jgi:hypothetical protein